MSLFITFEGIDGTGKTTQIQRLQKSLQEKGYSVDLTREPGGTPIGDQIRQILLSADNSEIVPVCELFLYAAQRAQHMEERIVPALKQGKIVLCDRFTDATTAYQGYGRGFPQNLIRQLNQMTVGQTRPELTFLLDCDPQVGLGRAKARVAQNAGPAEDRFEREALAFHQRTRDGYLAIAKQEPDRVIVLDASQSPEALEQAILTKTLAVLKAGRP